VSHRRLAIYIKKYLKAKEELRKFKYFTMQKYINLQKKFLYKYKETKILQRYLKSMITNKYLKFQHKPKISCFKNPRIKNRPIVIIIT